MTIAAVLAGLALVVLMALAWADAGIEPVRPMTAQVNLPEAAR